MKLSLVLAFLVLSVYTTAVYGSLSCLLRCRLFISTSGCDCNTQLDHLSVSELAERQAHHHHHHTHHPHVTSPEPEPETTPMPVRNLKTTTIEPKLKTTTDICDTLCKIQLGGDACNCSMPGLPGRRK